MIVTIDGPAGAGKSSAARALARRLGFEFLDTFNSNPDWRHVPVVIITAKQLTAAERGLLAVRTVIEKGETIDRDIAAAIAKAVGKRSASADVVM